MSHWSRSDNAFSFSFRVRLKLSIGYKYSRSSKPEISLLLQWTVIKLGIASILIAIIIRGFQQLEMLDQVFSFFAAACIACSLVCYLLPRLDFQQG